MPRTSLNPSLPSGHSAANGRSADADSAERNRNERRGIRLPAVARLTDGSAVNLKVVDLSHSGCKVETPVALAPGSCITVSVLELGVLDASVRWYVDGYAGLRFSDGPHSKEVQPREHERVSLQAAISLRRRSGLNYIVRTTDVSPSGCKVEFVDRPSVGDIHWIRFEGLQALEGEVRWSRQFRGGVQFRRPSIQPYLPCS